MSAVARRFLLALGLLTPALSLSAPADPVTEVVPLTARTPDELVPIISALAGNDGSVTAFAGQLVIRATPERMAEIRRVLTEIDHPARRLVIHVRRRDAHGPETGDADRGRLATRGAGESVQRVLALEGHAADLQAGVSEPVAVGDAYWGGWMRGQERVIAYRDATTGFRVVPRLAGEDVTLEIVQHAVRSAGGAPTPPFTVQGAETTVRGRLGEWIPLAASASVTRSGRGPARAYGTRREGDVRIDVMVEVLPDR